MKDANPNMNNTEKWEDALHKIRLEVEAEYDMGGLSSGLYGDYAADVAIRFAKLVLSQERSRLREEVEKMKQRHELDLDTYENSSGGRMCAMCGEGGYEENGECSPSEVNEVLNKILSTLQDKEPEEKQN